MLKKILIANRGEIALRVIRACKELGIRSVAVYSEADIDSMHVQLADEAICIGPPPSIESYLKVDSIISAAEIAGVDAIHPGYGFLSEKAEFAEICESCDIKFIGPNSKVINLLGNKNTARATARKAGVPITPGSDGITKNSAEALKIARELGYPVMIKAVAGGGGKGMRKVFTENDFKNAYQNAQREAQAAFGNGDIYLEKLLVNPRHIEFQIVSDSHGNVAHLGERDCSLQRRNQKILEETPSPALSADLRKKMGEAAVALARESGYENCGTIEFLLDEKSGDFFFMEMNARIQVEHPITEEVYGCDLIKEQIRIASGEPISKRLESPRHKLHSIEARINAEDSEHGFRPSPGKISFFYAPGGLGVRVDTHVYSGYTVPPHYDSMIAKLIVTGIDRETCVSRMRRALDEFIVEGIQTSIPFLKRVTRTEDFSKGTFHTSWVEDYINSGQVEQS